MAAVPSQADVVVLGSHPSATFAALLLADAGFKPVQVALPDSEPASRGVILNPELFNLHPSLKSMQSKLKLWPGHGLRFLGEGDKESIDTAGDKPVVYVGDFEAVTAQFDKARKAQKLASVCPKSLAVESVDERGVTFLVDEKPLATRAVVVAEMPDASVARPLNLPKPGDGEKPQDYSILRLPAAAKLNLGKPESLPMSLNLAASGAWAWVLPSPGGAEVVVMHPADRPTDPKLLDRWLDVLQQHGVLTLGPADRKAAKRVTVSLKVAGALHGETVANRALLVGPAGGFLTACSEEVYPSLWSAKLAVEHLVEALAKPFLQDGLASFPQTWGATLGDYLRGPQQNLKFLLPLVFRNAVMAKRLSDAILTGESVVR